MDAHTLALPTDDFADLLAAAEAHDHVPPLSEAYLRALAAGGGEAWAVGEEGLAVRLPDGNVELVVHPRARRRGIGTALWRASSGRGAWAHGDLPQARAAAEAWGLHKTRELYVMAIDRETALRGIAAPEVSGLRRATYAEAVADFGAQVVDAAWVEANNDAFSWHPEQGGWDVPRLHAAMDTDWFDADGVVFYLDGARVAGFHFTKWHGQQPSLLGSGRTVRGEVYVVGLAGDYQGRGLGTPIVAEGVWHLLRRGAGEIVLYVEAENAPAVATYQKMGFRVVESHALYTT
ncbi:mycothiol synthase [Corynebacterium sp. 13CS0277]|uniref:mycothiol synthase n=1 Tax=Corynebacterium sp. 13CS0277 TaxID=2071994 RepID=UPI000D02275D|nr:mycothiol synthase [Corynebacterium sp. 13CS0277]PRQ11310.1 mycothiol synthase [Corynebacterium sp. 13CS0277]